MNFFTQHILPIFDEPVASGSARLVRLVLEASGESLVIAVLGEHQGGIPFARVVTPRVLKCLPQDLGYACHSFGSLVVADYLAWREAGHEASLWKVPLGGVEVGERFEVEADNAAGVVDAVLERCALFHRRQSQHETATDDASKSAPRPSSESRFANSVKREVLARRPSLENRFNRTFSLTGSPTGFPIDYVGHSYATCYAAIDPKSKTLVRSRAASAALWRLARARDAFGFASPERMELTAWVPSPGLPIYSDSEYAIVEDTVGELREQALKEKLDVFSAYDAHCACERLMEREVATVN
ncbi:conserved hypothetical protein [Paraburkholderia ribeironis]|uniref:Uncharacterized protein n=1 Tax=Paraburkholderia ribeironis TaxID=1247936 RepID=A0A1N7SD49_9BURK|nr:hypothetical protein [Paraburkholderia ribeironis]SIT45300.1 conserved hypothetical protein [Paraburkholderia ribeironis]